jgi:hypothetical protein
MALRDVSEELFTRRISFRGEFMKSRLILFCVLALTTFANVQHSEACACCASGGEFHKGRSKITKEERSSMSQIKFSGSLKSNIEGDEFSYSAETVSSNGNELILQLKDSQTQADAGKLTVKLGGTLESQIADISAFFSLTAGEEPKIYAQQILTGKATYSGSREDLKANNSKTSLVFQNVGNVCASFDQAEAWILKVEVAGGRLTGQGRFTKSN